jgi:hypothetical protein
MKATAWRALGALAGFVGTELFAESNVPVSGRQGLTFPMWGDPVAAPITAPTPPTTPA